MPAHNAERYVGAAIRSALGQTYRHLEVVVVDDGSTDGTAGIVERLARGDPRVRLYQQANAGVAASRNRGIQEARGELIAPLDSDDLWYPDKLERQVDRLLEGGPTVGLVYCACVRIDARGRLIRPGQRWRIEGRMLAPLLMLNVIENASIPLMRRRCVEEAGGYNVERRAQGGEGCEDWELTLRIAERHELAVVPEYLMAYRMVPGSMSSDARAMGRGHALLLEDLARRRPDLPEAVFRWSRGHFSLYLAELMAVNGNGRASRRWLTEAVRADRWAALSPWAAKTLIRSAAAGRARDNSSMPPGDPGSGGSLPPREGIAAALPMWNPLMPYDRLCLARWRRLTGATDPAP